MLIGLDLWFGRGLRPATGILGLVHLAGPMFALSWPLEPLIAGRAKVVTRVAFSSSLTFVLAVVTYGIGQSAR